MTQVKQVDTDGYEAIQLGYGERKESRTTKAAAGHFKKAGTSAKQNVVEFDGFEAELNLGDAVTVSLFEEGEYVVYPTHGVGKILHHAF